MTYLNAQQLAFLLDIKKEDARARMCNAWCKSKGIEKEDSWKTKVAGTSRTQGEKGKIKDPYPQAMPIDMLSDQLNLPGLQAMVNDIVNNYLVRPASKKWILCDYPEKKIKKAEEELKLPINLKLPPALDSMLPSKTISSIKAEWIKRFSKKNDKGEELVITV